MTMTRRSALAGAGVAVMAGSQAAAAASTPAETSDLTLWYEQPAEAWTEALPVGNGRLGAMVFGGVAEERLQLNEDSLWGGGPYQPANPEAREALPEVRRLVFAGDYKAATDLVTAKVMAKPVRQMSYQTVGELKLSFPGLGPAQDYRRSLDLDAAVAATRFRSGGASYKREVFASAPDGVLVVRLACDRPGGLDVDIAFQPPAKPEGLKTAVTAEGDLVAGGSNAAQNGVAGALTWEARARLRARGGRVAPAGSTLQVRGADSLLILVAIATSHRNFRLTDADPSGRNKATLGRIGRKPYARLLGDHQTDHQRLFRKVSVDFGRTPAADRPTDVRVRTSQVSDDPALAALYYQYGRYLLIACSRPGGQPANLQGLWNDSQSPPWGSKFTININTEMNYWPAEPTGLAECVEPLVEMVRDLAVTGGETARVMYGAGGWVTHHNTDLWRASAPIDGAKFGMWPTGGAWLCLHLWDRWDYGGDRAYLASIYPVLKGASQFFLDTLQPHPNGRWLVTNPSMSPENNHHPDVSMAAGPTMDNQILRDLFAHTAEAAEILGTDADFRARVLAARDRLPPDRIGAQGQLQEWLDDWDATAVDIHHRHVSHLYGLFPSGQISLAHTPALAAAARRSLEIRGDEATGWGLAWRLNLWARLQDGAHAHAILKRLLSPDRTYPNLFDAHPPFQIDGNFGGTSGMTEMLLQSLKGPDGTRELLLLPALPPAWKAGRISGLRARGGLGVDLAWRDGALTRVDFKAERTGLWRVSYGGAAMELRLAGGEARSFAPGAGRLQPVRRES